MRLGGGLRQRLQRAPPTSRGGRLAGLCSTLLSSLDQHTGAIQCSDWLGRQHDRYELSQPVSTPTYSSRQEKQL